MDTNSITLNLEKDAKNYSFWRQNGKIFLTYTHSESQEESAEGDVIISNLVNYIEIDLKTKEEIGVVDEKNMIDYKLVTISKLSNNSMK
jgi:hypothetical protein